MKKRINVWAAALAVIGVAVAVPMRAEAATAAELATAINGWSGGGTGTLDAIASGNEVTVTGTVTNATTALSLNIDAGVTVLWSATLSGGSLDSRISLSGGGLFQMENGSAITQSGSGYAINMLTGPVSININGGTVSSTSSTLNPAIGSYSTGTITINGGTVTSNSSIAISNTGTGAVTINGGKVESGAMVAINSGEPNSSVTITGGEILTTADDQTAVIVGGTLNMTDGTISANNGSGARGIMLWSSATVTISGGTVSATGGGSAIDNSEGGNVTIHGTVTINGNTSGNIIRYFVPPTGLPDLAGWTIAMYILFAVSLSLWGNVGYGYISRRTAKTKA